MDTISNRSTPSTDTAPCQLLALPLELRLSIYEHLFRRSYAQQELIIYQRKISDSKFRDSADCGVDPVPLLCTCREIYTELRSALFRKFHYTISFGRKICPWECEYHHRHVYDVADYTGFPLLRYVTIRLLFEDKHDVTMDDLATFARATNQGESLIRLRFDFRMPAHIEQSRFDAVVNVLRQLRPRQPILASISSSSKDSRGLDLSNYHRMIAESRG